MIACLLRGPPVTGTNVAVVLLALFVLRPLRARELSARAVPLPWRI